jgi:hypothetical protein
MTAIAFGRRLQCDVCLKQAQMEGDYDQSAAYLDEPVPEGWTSMRAVTMGVRLEVKNMWGTFISHLCDECSALTVGGLVRKIGIQLQAQMEAERAAK